MQILFVTPEVAPFSGAGELSEVCGALPPALQALGLKVTVVAPFYDGVAAERYGLARRIRRLSLPLGAETIEFGLVEGKFPNCDVGLLLIDHPDSFQRSEPATEPHRGFFVLAAAALEAARELGLEVDLVHAHGWQSGFLPLLLRLGRSPALSGVKLVFTIPDASEAPLLQPSILETLGLGYELFNPEGIEFHGRVNLLKAGVIYSDRVITWSGTYARELQSEAHGAGLHGLFQAQADKLAGVLPGIDPAVWDPAADHRLAERFDGDSLVGKEACKRALLTELELPQRPQQPLLAMLGPLTESRGVDLLLRALPQLLQLKVQIALLGPPSAELGGALADAVAANPQSVAHRPGLLGPEALRRALAGADALLALPREEPGATLILKALRYGAVPVCHAVGALRDTVVDLDASTATGNGICFQSHDPEALVGAVHRLLAAYEQRRIWQTLVRTCMRPGNSWALAARRTLEVYQQALSS